MKGLAQLLFVIIFLTEKLVASVLDTRCIQSFGPLRAYIENIRAFSAGYSELYAPLRETFGEDIFADPAIRSLDLDLLGLMELPPEYRSYAWIAKKHSISEGEAKDLVLIYATTIFYDEPKIFGEPIEAITRLAAIRREYRLTDITLPWVRNRLYYLSNVTKLAVPEMAAQLGISEAKIRLELSRLQISIAEEFFKSKKVLEHDQPRNQAEKFFDHFQGKANRGVSWNRLATVEGQLWTEEQILVKLLEQGLSYQNIATRLNITFDSTDPDSENFRTHASVSSKLSDLGFSSPNTTGPNEIHLDIYGHVKAEGKLQFPQAAWFLFDRRSLKDTEAAEELGVSVSTLQEFRERHGVFFLSSKRNSGEEFLNNYGKLRGKPSHRINIVVKLTGALPNSVEDASALTFVRKIHQKPESTWPNELSDESRKLIRNYGTLRNRRTEDFIQSLNHYAKSGVLPKGSEDRGAYRFMIELTSVDESEWPADLSEQAKVLIRGFSRKYATSVEMADGLNKSAQENNVPTYSTNRRLYEYLRKLRGTPESQWPKELSSESRAMIRNFEVAELRSSAEVIEVINTYSAAGSLPKAKQDASAYAICLNLKETPESEWPSELSEQSRRLLRMPKKEMRSSTEITRIINEFAAQGRLPRQGDDIQAYEKVRTLKKKDPATWPKELSDHARRLMQDNDEASEDTASEL